jgi:hypothetical protein
MPPQMTKKERITQRAKDLLAKTPSGLRFSELVSALSEIFPDEAYGNITGSVWNLDARFPDEIYKPARGLFRLLRYKDASPFTSAAAPKKRQAAAQATAVTVVVTPAQIREEHFYRPFADWLEGGELEECTKAIALGGNRFREKWGTPDVFGIFKSRNSDLLQKLEVVVAEVKLDTAQLITAFGQACAYKLFAHKSYLVIPKDSPKEDVDRLDALCMLFGIGLILFDSSAPTSPSFQIRVRASRHEPDTFYANRYLKDVADDLKL